MERRAFFGTLALAAAQAAKLGLQLAVLPILARILGPASYGLVALAMPFILLANMVSDAGLGSALVRVESPSPELESTIFWLSMTVCGGLVLAIWLIAWPISKVLSAPGLPPILLALSPILLISGSLSVPNARIMRDRRFSVFAVGETVSSLVSALAAIGAALAGAGAWSLVVQQVVLWSIKLVWLTTASHFRPAFVCRPSLARPHLHFGLNAAGSNVADFVGKNAPTVIIGAMLGVAAVGHYAMAFQLVRVPDSLISGPLYLATFTAVARLGGPSPRTAALALGVLRGVAAGLAPVFAGLALVSDLVIRVLLGAKWIAAAPLLVALAPAGFLLCVYSIAGAILMGLGRSDWQFRLTLLGGAAMAAGALIGARFGLTGVAIGLSAGAVLAGPAYGAVLSRRIGVSALTLGREFASPLVATTVMAVAVVAVRRRIGLWGDGSQLAVAVAVGAGSFAAVLGLLSGRQMLNDLKGMVPGRSALGAGAPAPAAGPLLQIPSP